MSSKGKDDTMVDIEKLDAKLNDYLKNIYYDEDKNVSSLDRLYQQARESLTKEFEDIKSLLTRKNLKAFIEMQGAFQRTKTFKKKIGFFLKFLPNSDFYIG